MALLYIATALDATNFIRRTALALRAHIHAEQNVGYSLISDTLQSQYRRHCKSIQR
jgi:hypothetical protein